MHLSLHHLFLVLLFNVLVVDILSQLQLLLQLEVCHLAACLFLLVHADFIFGFHLGAEVGNDMLDAPLLNRVVSILLSLQVSLALLFLLFLPLRIVVLLDE